MSGRSPAQKTQLAARDWFDAADDAIVTDGARFDDCGARLACFTVGSHVAEVDAIEDCVLNLSRNSSGRLSGSFGGGFDTAELRSGYMTFVPPHVSQQFDFEGVSSNVSLSLSPRLLEIVAQSDPRFCRPDAIDPQLGFYRPALETLIVEYRRIMSARQPGWRVLAQSQTLLISCELLRAFSGDPIARDITPLDRVELTRLLDFLDGDLSAEPSLYDMAEACDRPALDFGAALEAATGNRPHQLILDRKMTRARDLLAFSRMPPADIAHAIGFGSPARFRRAFADYAGCEPHAMRPGRMQQ